jgi:choline dehydrogenase-like flavoprotein
MSEADIIIVGSGPAGVSVAFPLVQAGRRVLMLDGVGADQPVVHGAGRVLGPELEGLSVEDGLSPKLRAPEARLALARFRRAHDVEAENFLPVGSLARGGLSRVWGAFAAEFDVDDLAQLAFFLRFAEGAGDYVSGAIYETQGLPASSFASQLPLGRRTGEALFRFLSPALIVAVTYFPGGFSENRLRFEPSTRRLTVIGGFRAGFPDLARRVSGSWHATGVRWARYPWQGASWRCLGQTLISLEPCPWEAGAPTAPMF